MIDRKIFFEGVRNRLFGGKLSQSQVDGMNTILDEWEHRKLTDIRHLAYMLATTKWETAHTMQPIAEYGKGQGHSYGVPDTETGQAYYGRGFVQLTWKTNYQKMAALTGVDLVHHADLAMDPRIATLVLFAGMQDGLFTGRKLNDYFGPQTSDWVSARKIINGLDRAEEIAVLGRTFHEVLQAATERKAA